MKKKTLFKFAVYFILFKISIFYVCSQNYSVEQVSFYRVSDVSTPAITENLEMYVSRNDIINKYLTAGTLDSSFGVNGSLNITNIVKMVSFKDKLYIANGSNSRIARYNSDGKIDLNFGQNGLSELINLDGGSVIDMIVNKDYSIYILTRKANVSNDPYKMYRILSDGSLDNIFGQKNLGTVLHILKKGVDGSFFLKTSKIVNASTEYNLVKYKDDGSVDITFGNSGTLVIPNGEIYINNENEVFIRYNYNLYKYNSSGQLSTGFSNNGVFDIKSFNVVIPYYTGGNSVEPNMIISNVEFQEDGKILMYGGNSVGSYPTYYGRANFIGRINSNGSLDGNFNKTSSYFIYPANSTIVSAKKNKDDNKFVIIENRRESLMVYKNNAIMLQRKDLLNTAEFYNSNIVIYPNPITDVFNVKLNPTAEIKKIQIFSADGKVVYQSITNQNNINFLRSGVYLINIKTSKGNFSSRIIKK